MRALMRRRDVGHIGGGRRQGGTGDTGNDAADEQIPDEGSDRHHQVIEGQAEQRGEQHRAAAEAVGQIAQHRRKHELHESVSKDQVAADHRRIGDAAAGQLFQQFRQDRHDDANTDHVEQNGDQDAGKGQARAGRSLHITALTF